MSALKGCAIRGSCTAALSISFLAISNTSGAIHLRVPIFNVWWENLVLEFFVFDNPKSASFAFTYPSSYLSSGAPVRGFTKTFKDLRSRCATRLLCKYFNPRATWSVISLKLAENSDTSKVFSSQVSSYFFLHKLLCRVLPMIYSCQTGVSLKRNRFHWKIVRRFMVWD
jgi:hypothetical protein